MSDSYTDLVERQAKKRGASFSVYVRQGIALLAGYELALEGDPKMWTAYLTSVGEEFAEDTDQPPPLGLAQLNALQSEIAELRETVSALRAEVAELRDEGSSDSDA